MAEGKRSIPLWARITASVTAAIVALVAVGVGLRYWITSDGGRAFIVSQIDGRKLGPLGVIRVSGLKGDPLKAATLADIALVDDNGVWLRAKDAEITWTPFRLFGGDLEIQSLNVKSIEVERQPHTTVTSKKKGGAPNIGLDLQALSIHELKLASGVLGPAASFTVGGALSRAESGSGSGRLDVTPLDGPGDRIKADASWSRKGALNGVATASGPAGGALATILMAPDGRAVNFDARLSGTYKDFSSNARLVFGTDPVVTFNLVRNADVATLKATLAPSHWALLGRLEDYSGGPVVVTADGKLADPKRAGVTARITAPAGAVNADATVNLDRMKLAGPVTLGVSGYDLDRITGALKGHANAEGVLKVKSADDWSWTGDAAVAGLAFPGGGAAKASAPVTVAMSRSAIRWETAKASLTGGRINALPMLAPANYTLSTRGDYNLRTHTVDIQQAEITGQAGSASGRGSYDVRSDAMQFSGAAMLARLQDAAPLTGSARGEWSVSRTSGAAPIRIAAKASGRNVASGVAALAQALGPSPEISLSAVSDNGQVAIESGTLAGAGVQARLTGRISDAGALTGQANGALRRPIDLGGARLSSLTFTAGLSGTTDEPKINLRLTNGGLSAAGMTLSDLAGTAQLDLGKSAAGQFSLGGDVDGRKLVAAGKVAGNDGAYRLTDVSAQLGDLALTAPLLAYDHGDFDASFKASGSLAGIDGISRGDLDASGKASLKDSRLTLSASGQANNVRRAQARIQKITFEASAANDTAKLSGHIAGTAGVALDLGFGLTANHAAQGWTGEATLDGKVDDRPLSTRQPAKWTYGTDGWSLNAALAAFDGEMTAKIVSNADTASSDIGVTNIDLLALTRLARVNPVQGRITGTSSFANRNGVPVADLDIKVTGANPAGVTADPVAATITGQLRNGRFEAAADASGQGFRLNAAAIVPFGNGKGFNVAPNREKPLQANLSVEGHAEQLWALFGPEDQSLRGEVNANVKVGGTLAKPDLQGGFAIAKGVYDHGETGLHLTDIAAAGSFDQNSARITNLTANDGAGGTLTGQGDIDWRKTLEGGVKFTATNLRALGRQDRSAVVSGNGAVTLKPDAVEVSGDLQVSQARISIEQPAAAAIPTLPNVRHVNFRNVQDETAEEAAPGPKRPVRLDLKVSAPRRIVVFGRGLDTEWSTNLHVTGPVANPMIDGDATLVRGTLDLAGRRFAFDSGSVHFNGPVSAASVDISASRDATDVNAQVHVTGSPLKPVFTLESTPSLPQDEILARVIFGKSASQLSGIELAQLAAGLAQLAGGQAAFDPAGLLRQATGLDRVSIGADDTGATASAGKYITDDVYLQVGAGGTGGFGAQVEWEPSKNLSVTSGAQANGDTRIGVRWKKDY
ncbi:MAG: hypothetical protein GC155_03005 [Alphaproteobacteria bacterium]|nr:hypothetical protein [Alphaproteobacteria bacterium]